MSTDPRTVDPKNISILHSRLSAREKLSGPRVGDWLRRLDGSETRMTHIWDLDEDGLHVQDGGTFGGSFYLQSTGHEDYSGGLNPGIPASTMELTEEIKDGLVWFFDRDWPGADRGVTFKIQERVWRVIATP